MPIRNKYGLAPTVQLKYGYGLAPTMQFAPGAHITFELAVELATEGMQPLVKFIAENHRYLTNADWYRIEKLLQPLRRRKGHPAGAIYPREREREAVRLIRAWRSKEYPGRKRLPRGVLDKFINRAIKEVRLPLDHNTRRNLRNELKSKRHSHVREFKGGGQLIEWSFPTIFSAHQIHRK
jgi:hypothetical protein